MFWMCFAVILLSGRFKEVPGDKQGSERVPALRGVNCENSQNRRETTTSLSKSSIRF
jgi:hypothetical protein